MKSMKRHHTMQRRQDRDARDTVRLRPLGLAAPLQGVADRNGEPIRFRNRGAVQEICQCMECWRVDDEWWRDPISRIYFQVVLGTGQSVILYHDLVRDQWFLQ
jgi:hypothetical protein